MLTPCFGAGICEVLEGCIWYCGCGLNTRENVLIWIGIRFQNGEMCYTLRKNVNIYNHLKKWLYWLMKWSYLITFCIVNKYAHEDQIWSWMILFDHFVVGLNSRWLLVLSQWSWPHMWLATRRWSHFCTQVVFTFFVPNFRSFGPISFVISTSYLYPTSRTINLTTSTFGTEWTLPSNPATVMSPPGDEMSSCTTSDN